MSVSTDVKAQFVDAYYEGADQVPANWRPTFQFRSDDIASLKLGLLEGTATVPSWNGSADLPQATVNDIGSKTVNYAQYGLQLRIRKLDARDDGQLVPQVARRLGRAVTNTYANIGAAVYMNAFGSTTVVPGSKALAATDHPLGTGGTRSNKLTSALDLAGIFAAIQLARQWVDYDGAPYDLADGGWYLVFPTQGGLEQTVAQALGSQYTSDQMQVNTASSYGITGVPWNKITDPTYWFMVSKTIMPLQFWERQTPEDTVEIDGDSRQLKLSVDFACAAFCVAQPSGFIGSDA